VSCLEPIPFDDPYFPLKYERRHQHKGNRNKSIPSEGSNDPQDSASFREYFFRGDSDDFVREIPTVSDNKPDNTCKRENGSVTALVEAKTESKKRHRMGHIDKFSKQHGMSTNLANKGGSQVYWTACSPYFGTSDEDGPSEMMDCLFVPQYKRKKSPVPVAWLSTAVPASAQGSKAQDTCVLGNLPTCFFDQQGGAFV
jgi:hypothetical protein